MINKLKNIDGETSYWDEGNKNNFPWYKKGKMKRCIRKRLLRKQMKQINQIQL